MLTRATEEGGGLVFILTTMATDRQPSKIWEVLWHSLKNQSIARQGGLEDTVDQEAPYSRFTRRHCVQQVD